MCRGVIHSRSLCCADDICVRKPCEIAYVLSCRFSRLFFLSLAPVCRLVMCLRVSVGLYSLDSVHSLSFASSVCCVSDFTLVFVTAFSFMPLPVQ